MRSASAISKLNKARDLVREAARELAEAKAPEAAKADEFADQLSYFAKTLW